MSDTQRIENPRRDDAPKQAPKRFITHDRCGVTFAADEPCPVCRKRLLED